MAKLPEELAHIEWLGYVQPVGLVVSIPAMLEAQCYINKNILGEHARFLSCLPADDAGVVTPEIRDLREFVQSVLGWESADLVDVPQRDMLTGALRSLEVFVKVYEERIRPTHAVPVFQPKEGQNPWMMLIQELPVGTELDETSGPDSSHRWSASPQAKFERLLQETDVPIGLLSNRRQLRLVYKPRIESSGFATFNVAEMAQVAGRPMFAALQMLISSERMFSLGENQRLPAILQNSRKYQNTVSTKLAEQVLAALYELMRGFQAANDVTSGRLLGSVLKDAPNQVYSGLLTVLMRLVFVLYAEDRDLLSSDPIYSNHYSVSGLFNRLREEAGRYPDTMDQRFGAWSQLVTLFRLVYEGGQHGEFKLPPRKGYLFDPDRYPFLEGRASGLEVGESDKASSVGEKNVGYSVVPRSKGVATGHGFDSGMLYSDEGISQGGTVRADESDTSSSKLDSSEHRRRLSEGQEGVPTVPEDRTGKPDRGGNTPDGGTESRGTSERNTDETSRHDGQARTNAQQIAADATGVGDRDLGLGGASGWGTETGPNKKTKTQSPRQNPNPEPQIPRVSDGVIYRVLKNLLILECERLSYRTLDVEQIGSVYEAVMGFNLQVAGGKSIAIKPVKSHGAPATINLEALLETPGKDRAKWLKENADQTLGAVSAKSLKAATTIDELLEALDKKI